MTVASLPRRVFDGFGNCEGTRATSVFAEPRSADEVAAFFARATEEGVPVAMRGSGRSYGDAALNREGLVLDMRRMDRVLAWDPATGILTCEPGLSIDGLWRHVLADGYWPPVVPGTAFPTLGGCLAMNIHGKNQYKLGGIGDQVLELELVAPSGQRMTLSREQRPDLFHAVIGGFGMLGCITRLTLKLKRVHGGRLKVWQYPARSLAEQFSYFEGCLEDDYYVSWVDCIHGGADIGRGQIHRAVYTQEGEDPQGKATLDPEGQAFPKTMMGVPLPLVPMVLKLFYTSNFRTGITNLAKYYSSRFGSQKPYFQAHAAFHFLLDQMVGFRDAYQPGGFIQYQPFVPRALAPEVFGQILRRCKQAGIVSYLGVLKRYRPDDFLLSHALDGYSLAMDFPVTRQNREALWKLTGELSELVLEAGGRFYPAKDMVLTPTHFQRAFGQEAIARFRAIRAELDPARVLRTDWAARVGVDEPA